MEQQQNGNGGVVIGTHTSTDKNKAREEAEKFLSEQLGEQKQISWGERMGVRRAARKLRRLYKETDGKVGISEEVYQEVLQVLKEMR